MIKNVHVHFENWQLIILSKWNIGIIGTFHSNYVGIDFSVKRDLQDFKMDLSAIKLEFDSCLEFIKYHLKCTSLALVFGGMWESVCAFLSISFILVFCLIANSSRSICLIFCCCMSVIFYGFPCGIYIISKLHTKATSVALCWNWLCWLVQC